MLQQMVDAVADVLFQARRWGSWVHLVQAVHSWCRRLTEVPAALGSKDVSGGGRSRKGSANVPGEGIEEAQLQLTEKLQGLQAPHSGRLSFCCT